MKKRQRLEFLRISLNFAHFSDWTFNTIYSIVTTKIEKHLISQSGVKVLMAEIFEEKRENHARNRQQTKVLGLDGRYHDYSCRV